jgi:hypothetical protein
MSLVTNFLKKDFNLYVDTIREYNRVTKSNNLRIETYAFGYYNKLLPDCNSLHRNNTICDLSEFWRIFDNYSKTYTLYQIRNAFLKENIDYSISFLDKLLKESSDNLPK